MNPDPSAPIFRLGAFILAAGASRRMGRPKLLLPWGETTILGHLINQWHSLGTVQVAIVCAAQDIVLAQELDRLHFNPGHRILNPAPDTGMFGSIQCAARWPGWRGDLTHLIMVLGDQPHLLKPSLQTLIQGGRQFPDRIGQLRSHGHPRHPVLFPQAYFKELSHTPAENLQIFLKNHASVIQYFDCTDAGLELDIDYAEDYQMAQRLYFASNEESAL